MYGVFPYMSLVINSSQTKNAMYVELENAKGANYSLMNI